MILEHSELFQFSCIVAVSVNLSER